MTKFNNIVMLSEDGIGVELQVLFFKEDGITAAYAPALDLFGYGESEEKARSSFETVLQEFIRYTTENDTLEAELKRLGWNKKHKSGKLSPPGIKYIIDHNPVAQDIYDKKEFHQKNQIIPVSA